MKSDLNFYLDVRSVKHGFKNTAGSFELDERLCEIENQIEQDNQRKRDLQATYWKKEGKRRPSMQFDIAKIQSMIEQKIIWVKIADAFGVSDHCMRGFAKKNGIYVAISSGARRKVNLDSEQLKAFVDQGLTWMEIGDSLNVSHTTARNSAVELGIIKPNKREQIDLDQLKALIDQGMRWRQIGDTLNISYAHARTIAIEQGFFKSSKRDKIDVEQLKALIEQGLNWRQISSVLGVHSKTPRKRAVALGLIKQDSRRKNRDE